MTRPIVEDPYAINAPDLKMSNQLLIITSDQHITEPLKTILSTMTHSTLTSPPATPLPSDILPHIFLALIPDSETAKSLSLTQMNLPSYIPALVLGTTPQPPPEILKRIWQQDTQRIYDYLGEDQWKESLHHRITVLKNVFKLSYERSSYLQHQDRAIEFFTSRDNITGLYNQHQFNKIFSKAFDRYREKGEELSLLFINIDFFREINKTCGRSFADFVLNEISTRLTGSVSTADTCFRISGVDFLLLMPGSDEQAAKNCAHNILKDCTTEPFSRNGMVKKVSLSIGLVSATSIHPTTREEFIHMGEMALYQAKAEGRGRVYVFARGSGQSSKSVKHDFETIKLSINRILEKTRNSAISSLQLLARDIAGPEHREHLERATRYTQLLCDHLGLPSTITQTLKNSLILHTSIRYFLHNDLLTKQAPFTEEDRELLRDYPYKLSEIVAIFDYFSQERQLLTTRSENFDGSGYPEGLQSSEIPLGARILNIVDSFAAMEGKRPHRSDIPPDKILNELKEQAGKQFDPFLVVNFMDIIFMNKLLEMDAKTISDTRKEIYRKYFT